MLGPKRLSQIEIDLEVERYTRSYKNASDMKLSFCQSVNVGSFTTWFLSNYQIKHDCKKL